MKKFIVLLLLLIIPSVSFAVTNILWVHRSTGQNVNQIIGTGGNTGGGGFWANLPSDFTVTNIYCSTSNGLYNIYGIWTTAHVYGGAAPTAFACNLTGTDLKNIFIGTGQDYIDARAYIDDFDIVVFKHCFDISFGTTIGEPIVNNYAQWQSEYNSIKNSAFITDHQNIKFVFMGTLPGRSEASVNYTDASAYAARVFNTWLETTWDIPSDNIYVLNVFTLMAGANNFLRSDYVRVGDATNSHPNSVGNQMIAVSLTSFLNSLITANQGILCPIIPPLNGGDKKHAVEG